MAGPRNKSPWAERPWPKAESRRCPRTRRRTEVTRTHPRLGSKCEAAAGTAQHQFLRHLLGGEIDKVLPTAMHRHHVLQVELLQLRHDLAKIVVRRGRQVKATDERVDLFDAADLLGALQGVDDAGMPAGADGVRDNKDTRDRPSAPKPARRQRQIIFRSRKSSICAGV